MATTRIKDLSKTATTVNSDANLVLDGNTGGTQKISRDNFRQDTADAFVAAPGTYNLAPLNSGTGKIDAVYLSSTSDSPKGAWNASTNTPTLADGSGTAGDYYDVTVAGSSDLGSGSIAFTVGDVVKYNGTVWFKIDSVANILDGVSTIDGAKTAIEIPDVGTAPNEVPLNGQLGTMAFQDSAGISVGEVEASNLTVEAASASTDPILTTQAISGASTITGLQVTAAGAVTMSQNLDLTGDEKAIKFHSWESGNQIERALIKADGDPSGAGFGGSLVIQTSDDGTFAERMRVDPQGRVGIGTASPSAGAVGGRVVHVQSTGETASVRVDRTDAAVSGTLSITCGSSTNGLYSTGTKALGLSTNGTQRWLIDGSNGNLISQGGSAIDFGSGSALSDYEEGTHTATLTPSSSGTITLNSSNDTIGYTRVGDLVTVTGALVLSSVSSPVGNYIEMSLPFSIATLGDSAGSFTGAAIVFGAAGNSGDYSWLGVSGGSAARLYKTTGVYAVATAADFSGDEDIYVNFTYHTTD